MSANGRISSSSGCKLDSQKVGSRSPLESILTVPDTPIIERRVEKYNINETGHYKSGLQNYTISPIGYSFSE